MLDLFVRKFRNDFTYNHMKGVEFLMKQGGELYSIDLSNATDTLPVDLGLRLILRNADRKFVPDTEQFIADVKSVMVERNFHLDNEIVRYSTGQPMGAYASFPLLAMTNHLLVNMARKGAGLRIGSQRYAIVGDDIVISGRKTADIYVSLLEALGVPINHKKVVIGRRTFEFCRRIVRDGKIVSVPSWNSYYQAATTGDLFPLLNLISDYGYELPSYASLLHFSRKRDLRNMLALHEDLHLHGEPNITRIPFDIVTHADRVLSVLDSIKDEKKNFSSDDPYLKRLKYNYTIASMFRKSILKYGNAWEGVFKCKANSFYLSYVKTYTEKKKSLSRY